jgi:hypothetical protein
MKTNCASCRFRHGPDDCGFNWCRRWSPVPRLTYEGRHDDFGTGVWPTVRESDWCGEYQALSNMYGTGEVAGHPQAVNH